MVCVFCMKWSPLEESISGNFVSFVKLIANTIVSPIEWYICKVLQGKKGKAILVYGTRKALSLPSPCSFQDK